MIKTYHVESLGCAKNQVDSELFIAALESAGLVKAPPEEAGLIVVRSCGFIESAKRESINTLISLRGLNPGAKIALTGCLASRHLQELKDSLFEADFISEEFDMNILEKGPPKGGAAAGERPLLSRPGSAYIKIAEGCRNRCSFCAIPIMRGGLKSRSISEIKAEFDALLLRGIKEFCLIAQDTASFGLDTEKRPLLAELLRELLKNGGSFWIRLLYIHPDRFPHDIVPVMKADSRVLPYFDLPFQHANERILSLMGRNGNAKIYLGLIEKIRSEFPEAVIRSTFLTGFPTEDAASFKELCAFQREAGLDWLGVFVFSREEGTAAYNLFRRVPPSIALGRKEELEKRQTPITEKRLERWAGITANALIEEEIKEGLYSGRGFMHAPEVDGALILQSQNPLRPGDMASVKILSRSGFDLKGRALPAGRPSPAQPDYG